MCRCPTSHLVWARTTRESVATRRARGGRGSVARFITSGRRPGFSIGYLSRSTVGGLVLRFVSRARVRVRVRAVTMHCIGRVGHSLAPGSGCPCLIWIDRRRGVGPALALDKESDRDSVYLRTPSRDNGRRRGSCMVQHHHVVRLVFGNWN